MTQNHSHHQQQFSMLVISQAKSFEDAAEICGLVGDKEGDGERGEAVSSGKEQWLMHEYAGLMDQPLLLPGGTVENPTIRGFIVVKVGCGDGVLFWGMGNGY
eukprot:TRINITY_DN205_c0_g1_i5.p2 TRINITY_DN205_c0_g1~~TRINITY_DN205_c0_g1_i5.p2  ORF type:complete len:102 (+),score=11.36 TRINITY_DN205_c0_g1_i5:500-805(+)